MNNGLHTNGLSHPVNHNNNSIRLSNNNNNKILTSNDRILNQGIKPLSQTQQETINKLVMFQEEFEAPPDDDLRKITVSLVSDGEKTKNNSMHRMHLLEFGTIPFPVSV